MNTAVLEPTLKETLSPSLDGLATHAAVLELMVRAFRTDPATRWIFTAGSIYTSHFAEFVTGFAGAAFAHNTVDVAPGLAGAALWLPPGLGPDDSAVGELLTSVVPEARQLDVFTLLDQMGAYHPSGPHWYLPMIGVDPQHQGRGIGSALLRHALARCDRDGLPAYLESTHPRNVPLYERHGFRVLGEIRVADSPPVIPMLREPRTNEARHE